MIEAIREMPATEQGLIMGRLVSEISTAAPSKRHCLPRRLLLTGRQVPEVYATEVAREHADTSIARLDKEIENLLFETRVRKEVVSSTLAALLQRGCGQRQASLNVPQVSPLDSRPLEQWPCSVKMPPIVRARWFSAYRSSLSRLIFCHGCASLAGGGTLSLPFPNRSRG